MLLVLATGLWMGTQAVPGASGYSWTATYRDGVEIALPETTEPAVQFDARPGRCFTLTVCALPGQVCSAPSYEVCAEPLPGDADLDGAVGIADFVLWSHHFGQVAP